MDNNKKFKNEWKLYYLIDKNSWKIENFKKLYTITTPFEFWKLFNNWNSVSNNINDNYFIMKNDIMPMWEDENNKDGGCWTYKINHKQYMLLWEELAVYLVNELICPTIDDKIVGISLCIKKDSICIKIWNNNSKYNSLKYINEKILTRWGTGIIYIVHTFK